MLEFVKMQGCGNDYLFLDCLNVPPPAQLPALARSMSDRHFGAGADGLVLVLPARGNSADCRMQMFNSDGSEAEMCGNAIRCVAKLVYERGEIVREKINVETLAGLMKLELTIEEGRVPSVRVDMGQPYFSPPQKIGVRLEGERITGQPLEVEGRRFEMTCVSMGNPHAVIFLEEPVEDFQVSRYGPIIEHLPIFINRTNVEFVNVRGENLLRQRTWERGAGETLACGTGASAVAVASISTGRCCPGKVDILLNGGALAIEWRDGESVFMTGPAEEVYTGRWPD